MGTRKNKFFSGSRLPFLKDGLTISVEVKSGKVGKLKSLLQYVELSDVKLAIRLYAGPFQIDKLKSPNGKSFTLLNIPYYLTGNLEKYLDRYK